jgi:6-phosphogluconolactonase/glucosamine-6-phosphate isomerase/deaminase
MLSADQLKKQLAEQSQQGLKARPKQSLLVSTGLTPTQLAVQTLIG